MTYLNQEVQNSTNIKEFPQMIVQHLSEPEGENPLFHGRGRTYDL